MDDERIDLSPLDVTKDQLRYERLVRGVLSRTQRSVADDLARAGVRALAVAAVLAVLAWVPALLRRDDAARPSGEDHVVTLADFAAKDNAVAAASWFASGGVDSDE